MRRRRAAALAGAAALLGLAGSAAAADGPVIAFQDPKPVTVKSEPVKVTLCTSVQATISTGGFPDKAPVEVVPATAPPGCHVVEVKPVADPPPGKHSGVIVAYAPGAELATLTVTYDKDAKDPPTPVVTAPLNAFEFKGKFKWNSKGRGTTSLNALVFVGSAPIPDIKEGAVLGVVESSGDRAIIRATGTPERWPGDKDTYRVPIEVFGARGQGTFKGQLSLLKDKDGNPHTVTVVLADHWILLVLTVALGLAAGTVAKGLAGRKLPEFWLNRRRKALGGKYTKQGEPLCGYVTPGCTEIDAFNKKNKDAFGQYKKTVTLYDTAAPAYKAVKDQLTEAEKDAELVSSGTAFCAALEGLKTSLQAFDSKFDDVFSGEAKPVFATKAERLVAPQAPQLGVGQATKVKAQAEALASLLDDWTTLADAYERVADLRQSISDAEEFADERAKADQSLGLARAALLDLGDTGTVDKDEAVDAIRRAYAHVSAVPPAPPIDFDAEMEATAVDFDQIALVGPSFLTSTAGALTAGAPRLALPLPGAFAAPVVEALKIGLGWAGELYVALLAGGLALLTTLIGQYSGKPFGSWADYLAVFSAAAGAQALLGTLFTTLNSARGTSTA